MMWGLPLFDCLKNSQAFFKHQAVESVRNSLKLQAFFTHHHQLWWPTNPITSWWFQPLWKIWVKTGSSSPNRCENSKKSFELPPTRITTKNLFPSPFPPPFFQSVPGRVWTWAVVAGSSPRPAHRPAPTRRDHPAIELELMKTERSPCFATIFFLGDILCTCGFCTKNTYYMCVYIYIYIFLYSIYVYIYRDFEIHKMLELKGSNLCFAVCRGPNPFWQNISQNGNLPQILLMAEILHQLIGSVSHYLQGLLHPRWLFGISSINIKC